jgi:hypothetical protein
MQRGSPRHQDKARMRAGLPSFSNTMIDMTVYRQDLRIVL